MLYELLPFLRIERREIVREILAAENKQGVRDRAEAAPCIMRPAVH